MLKSREEIGDAKDGNKHRQTNYLTEFSHGRDRTGVFFPCDAVSVQVRGEGSELAGEYPSAPSLGSTVTAPPPVFGPPHPWGGVAGHCRDNLQGR